MIYYEDLFNAVVERAAEDYSKALCDYHNAVGPYDKKFTRNKLEELERFFTGEDIMAFTKLDGNMLLERLKTRAAACNYDWNIIKKSKS